MSRGDEKLVEQLKAWSKEATESCESYRRWRQDAIESYRFYTGKGQWNQEDLDALEKASRPALTINHILPIVGMAAGYQRKNRREIHLFPRRGGTVAVAAMGSALIKHTMDDSDGQFAASDAFLDGLICGRGWLMVDLDYTHDPMNGDLVVEKVSPFAVVEDQLNRQYDVNKGRFVRRRFWQDKDELRLMFPTKARDLPDAPSEMDRDGDQRGDAGDDYARASARGESDTDQSYRTERQHQVDEWWYKQWVGLHLLVNTADQSFKELPPEAAKRAAGFIAQLEGPSDYRMVNRVVPVLHRATVVGETVLEHVEDPFDGVVAYPFARFCPFWTDGDVMGLVDNLKDPQRWYNKTRSQSLHHLNQSAHSGWRVANAENAQALADLKTFGSRPGEVVDESKFGGKAEPIVPTPISDGHLKLAAEGQGDIEYISGINPDMLGAKTPGQESGRSRLIRQEAGLVVTEGLFDNWRRTQRSFGTVLWEIIRTGDVYSDEEIQAVVEEQDLRQFVTGTDKEGRPVVDFAAMRSARDGRYGVKVTDSPTRATLREANFEQMLDARKTGILVPDDVIVEASDWPNKEQIVARMQQQQAAAPAV